MQTFVLSRSLIDIFVTKSYNVGEVFNRRNMMSFQNSIKYLASLIALLALQAELQAQNGLGRPTNINVQLPVVSVFNVRTVVSVPDGGMMRLGGISRQSAGRISRGYGFTPLTQNRGTGFSTGANHANVTATIISNRELGQAVLSEGNRQFAIRQQSNPNGSSAVQSKADFISRNIGRLRK